MGGLGDLIVKIDCNLDNFEGGMAAVSSTVSKVSAEIESKFGGLQIMGANLATLGAGITAFITVPLVGLGTAAIETAAHFEQTQIAMTHFLGSAQQAGVYLNALYEFAKTTPFQIKALADGAQLLMAMGFAAKDTIPMLRMIGDQLSAVGRTDMMPQVILAFGEMKSFGVARMKELTQLTRDAVIPAVRYIAEYLGKTEGEVTAMTKKRMIDSATAITAITQGMARNSGGMMLEQMASFGGMVTNLKDNITLTLKGIGDQLLPYGKMFVEFFSGIMAQTRDLAQWFGGLSEPVKVFSLSLAGVTAAVGPLMVGVGGMLMLIAPLALAFGTSALALTGWGLAIGVGIAALAGLYFAVKDYLPGVWAVFVAVFQDIKAVAVAGWAALKIAWSEGLYEVMLVISPLPTLLIAHWSEALDLVRAFSVEFWNQLSEDWGKSARQLAENIIPGFSLLVAVLDKLPHSDYGKIFGDAVQAAREAGALAAAYKTLGIGANAANDALNKLKDPKTAWMDEHKLKLLAMSSAVTVLANAYGKGKASAAEFQAAVAKVTAEYNKVYVPPKPESGAGAAGKVKDPIKDAFSTLGIKDVLKDLVDFTAAFDLLRSKGKLTQNELIAGHQKIAELTEKVRVSTVGLTGVFASQAPVFNNFGKLMSGGLATAKSSLDDLVTGWGRVDDSAAYTAVEFRKLVWDTFNNSEPIARASKLFDGVAGSIDIIGRSIPPVIGLSEQLTRNLFQYADATAQASMMSAALAAGNTDLANFFFNAIDGSSHAAKAVADLSRSGDQLHSAFDFKELGITSQAELIDLANKAAESYTRIRDSGTASAFDIDRAWLAYYDRARAAGEVFSQATMAQTETIRTRVQGAIRDLSNSWAALGKQITQAISQDLSRAVGDAIFQTGKLGDAFKRMGQDVVDIILQKIIKQGIDALLNSLAGVQGIVGKIAGWFGGIATSVGGGAASAAGGVATTATQDAASLGIPNIGLSGGSGASGVASAAGGLSSFSSIFGMITGAVTAISSVVGNFQMAHMGSDITKIEESTRYIKKGFLDSGGLLDIITQWSVLSQTVFDWEQSILIGTLREIRDGIKGIVSITLTASTGGSLQDVTKSLGTYLASTNTAQTDTLLDMAFAINKLVSSSTAGVDRVVNSINTMSNLVVGQLSELGKIEKGGLLGMISKIQGILSGGLSSISGLSGGFTSGGISMIGGVLSAIKGLLPSHDETLYARIEQNTRYSALYLGDRADGGILGVSFRILDALSFGTATKALEKIADYGVADLDLIQDHTNWMLAKVDAINNKLNTFQPTSASVSSTGNGNIFNLNFYGIQNARDMAQAVVSELKFQGVHI